MSTQATKVEPTNPALAYKRRQEHRAAKRDGGGKNHNKRTVFASVDCPVHGMLRALTNKKEVYVAPPATKREKFSGCPLCKADKRRTS